jgi:hypothetical protein
VPGKTQISLPSPSATAPPCGVNSCEISSCLAQPICADTHALVQQLGISCHASILVDLQVAAAPAADSPGVYVLLCTSGDLLLRCHQRQLARHMQACLTRVNRSSPPTCLPTRAYPSSPRTPAVALAAATWRPLLPADRRLASTYTPHQALVRVRYIVRLKTLRTCENETARSCWKAKAAEGGS